MIPAVLVVGAGLTTGIAAAQQNTGATATAGANAQIQSDRSANLSPDEQKAEARTIVQSVSNLRGRISSMLDKARQEKDIIKINCLNDKLTQTDVTLRESQDHKDLLDTAIAINNENQRTHEFALLVIFRQRANNLEQLARQCVGDDPAVFSRATTVELRPNDRVSNNEQTEFREQPVIPDRPLLNSPVM